MNANFEDYIKGDVPVVVDFFHEYCEPSIHTHPVLKDVKQIVGSAARILKMNISKNDFYVHKYNIQCSPTILIFKNGKLLWRKSGIPSKHELIVFLAQNIN